LYHPTTATNQAEIYCTPKKKNGYVSDGFQEKHGPRFSPLCHSGGKHQRDRSPGVVRRTSGSQKRIVTIVLAFAVVGLAIAFLIPQKWTSKAVITPAEQTQWNTLHQMMVTLQVLDVDAKVSHGDVFNLFIKKFQSQSLLEEYKNLPVRDVSAGRHRGRPAGAASRGGEYC
jgi:hypothetical protein